MVKEVIVFLSVSLFGLCRSASGAAGRRLAEHDHLVGDHSGFAGMWWGVRGGESKWYILMLLHAEAFS